VNVLKIRVGKKRTIAIPKKVAEELGINEGSKLVLQPIPDAMTPSLRGRKSLKILVDTIFLLLAYDLLG